MKRFLFAFCLLALGLGLTVTSLDRGLECLNQAPRQSSVSVYTAQGRLSFFWQGDLNRVPQRQFLRPSPETHALVLPRVPEQRALPESSS